MTRYYLLATLIVVVLGSIVFARRFVPPDLRISAQPTGTPTVESPSRAEPNASPEAFIAQGPWVLSALPACFDEQSRATGTAAALAAKLPPPAGRIAPGTRLQAAGCSVLVGPHDVVVRRGDDRLRVPPDAALYHERGRLTLVVRTGNTVEIRRY